MFSNVELTQFLSWILAGGFEILVRWLVSLFPVWMDKLTEVQRAFIAAGVGLVLQGGAFALAVALALLPSPDPTILAWFNAMFPYLAMAVGIPMLMSGAFRRQYERDVTLYHDLSVVPAARFLGHSW